MSEPLDRRQFLCQTTALGTAAAGLSISARQRVDEPPAPMQPIQQGRIPYRGPNVILIRFGGGVRRLETITQDQETWCPFIYHELFKKRGVLFNNMEIESAPGIATSHGQGTLYLLTGNYSEYDAAGFSERFIPKNPTLFEYFRRHYDVPPHQALIVNGEDRINEEFFTFSNCQHYGVEYKSTVLSLYRFKTFLLRDDIASGRFVGRELTLKCRELDQLERLDYRVENRNLIALPEIDEFWRKWRGYFGRSGFVNPRGDRLLTTLSLWALRELRPRLLMINYQDPDYVHWGNPNFYTRAVAIIDDGVREIYQTCQALDEYRDNTIFLVVPDCGRDSNRCMAVPFQHHFNTRSAHEIFAVAAGPGIAHPARAGQPLIVRRNRPHQQASVAATIGQLMGFPTPEVDRNASPLEEMIA